MKIALGTGVAFIVVVVGTLLAIALWVEPCGGFTYSFDRFELTKACVR